MRVLCEVGGDPTKLRLSCSLLLLWELTFHAVNPRVIMKAYYNSNRDANEAALKLLGLDL